MPSLTNNQRSLSFGRIFTFAVLLFWLILVVLAIANRQNVIDYIKLIGYTEPSAISSLSTQDTFTSYSIKVFKVNHTLIENKADFNSNCPNNGGEQTIVLGCYHSNQNGIYLLSEPDPRLNGVEQVTAAHEMLHAVYDRLSTKDKASVNAMLLNYYNNDLTDQRIKNTIVAYKKSEPNEVVNEMHSVFGTEITNLTPQLERYYSKYFTNRDTVAAFAAEYQAEFVSRENAIANYDSQLANMKNQINSLESDLNSKQASLKTLQAQLNSERSSGNISEYNADVPAYNSQVNEYNNEVGQVRTLIANYNSLINQRNSVALIENQLYQELSGNTPNTIAQ